MWGTGSASSWRRTFPAVATAAVTTAALLGAWAQPASSVHDSRTTAAVRAAAVPAITWIPCRDGFECATVPVPLDYDRPDGETASISVVRLPAASPRQRIGALFLNPGGPGGSGVDIARGIAPILPLEIRARFDIVGFDPRGIMRSTPLRCYRTFHESLRDLPNFAYPETPRQENKQIGSDRKLASACKSHAGPILQHMSTADAARDMDRLRQAMGDARLNYLGFSYGSELGQTYAHLFPSRVRAMTIDGVIDPRRWAGKSGGGVPVGSRLKSAQGAQRTLGEFFRLCDAAGADCKFSGDARTRFAALVDAVGTTDVGVRKSDLIAVTVGALYAPFVWPDFARLLRDLERQASPATVQQRLATLRTKLGLAAPEQQEYPNFVEGFSAVLCSDANNPSRYHPYRAWADRAERDYGYFGRLWNWAGSACAVWPKDAGQDRYTGPWTSRTPNPVLVVGNYFDPATRYAGAVAASKLLSNSRLLSYAGWGHTAFMLGNYCVDAAVTKYLVTTRPPAKGKVCHPSGTPFGALQAVGVPEGAQAALAATLPAAVRQALRTP